jgi:tRNA dimethylallyltransferase
MSEKTKILAIVGPTASGKTALSIALAKKYNGEIISCDSMQIYRGMNIGTAKPDIEERDGVVHHMFDVADPTDTYSCADYVRDAKQKIEEIVSKGKLPIICGGTGLYLDSLLRGGNFEITDTLPEYRAELEALALTEGNDKVHALLAKVDPESAEAIHPNNLKRVIRALEIYKSTGVPKSVLDRESRKPESEYDALVIGLRFADREALYDRINRRVDIMLDLGLEEETRRLYAEGIFDGSGTAAQAIGYKELLGYIRGEMTLDQAKEELKTASRRYAKRQMTWFVSHSNVNWIDVENGYDFDSILCGASKLIDSFL